MNVKRWTGPACGESSQAGNRKAGTQQQPRAPSGSATVSGELWEEYLVRFQFQKTEEFNLILCDQQELFRAFSNLCLRFVRECNAHISPAKTYIWSFPWLSVLAVSHARANSVRQGGARKGPGNFKHFERHPVLVAAKKINRTQRLTTRNYE